MQFDDFCRDHGLLVGHLVEGRWIRVPTTDHPKKRNGAYKFMGRVGWCQNHAISPEVSLWRVDSEQAAQADGERARRRQIEAREIEARMQVKVAANWKRAAARGEQMVREATTGEHPYLQIKGLPETPGLLAEDGALIVPMRDCRTQALVGVQLIRWLLDERRYEKKMLPGMRAAEAVCRLGPLRAAQTWLVEGYATGLSVHAAVRLLCLRDAVLVCFSAGNLIRVAPLLPGPRLVFADNDESGAGQQAAIATGLPYCMSSAIGDANDLHVAEGIFKVASLMMDAMAKRDEGVAA